MFLRVAFAALLSVSTAAAATTEDDLRALEETRRDAIARQDFDVLRQIYAPEFKAIAGNGAVIDRDGLFELFRNVDRSLAFSVDEIRIIDLGDKALFLGRLVSRSGETIVSSARFSHTFVRKNGQWQCVFGQSTPVPGIPRPTLQQKALMRVSLLALTLAVAAPVAGAQPVAPNHPLIGTWRFTLPDGSCAETYRFRADGTSVVTSGDEIAETEFRIAPKPSGKGFYEWIDTIVKDNGKKDCAGQITDVGRKTTTYIQFEPGEQRFIVCRAESHDACFGPLRRVGGEDI